METGESHKRTEPHHNWLVEYRVLRTEETQTKGSETKWLVQEEVG